MISIMHEIVEDVTWNCFFLFLFLFYIFAFISFCGISNMLMGNICHIMVDMYSCEENDVS